MFGKIVIQYLHCLSCYNYLLGTRVNVNSTRLLYRAVICICVPRGKLLFENIIF